VPATEGGSCFESELRSLINVDIKYILAVLLGTLFHMPEFWSWVSDFDLSLL